METALPPAGTEKVPPEPPHSLFRCTDAELLQEVERWHKELGGLGAAEAVIVGLASELAEKDRELDHVTRVSWKTADQKAALEEALNDEKALTNETTRSLLDDVRERLARRREGHGPRWTKGEESDLRVLVAELGSEKWKTIAERLGTGRTGHAVEQKWAKLKAASALPPKKAGFIETLYDVVSNNEDDSCRWAQAKTSDGSTWAVEITANRHSFVEKMKEKGLCYSKNWYSFVDKLRRWGFRAPIESATYQYYHENFQPNQPHLLCSIKYLRPPPANKRRPVEAPRSPVAPPVEAPPAGVDESKRDAPLPSLPQRFFARGDRVMTNRFTVKACLGTVITTTPEQIVVKLDGDKGFEAYSPDVGADLLYGPWRHPPRDTGF